MLQFEIIDESGNRHGPFATRLDAVVYAADRALGDPRDGDHDDHAGGWDLIAPETP